MGTKLDETVQLAKDILDGDTGGYSNAVWRGIVERLIEVALNTQPVKVKALDWSPDGHQHSACAAGIEYRIAEYPGMSKPAKIFNYWGGDVNDPLRGHFNTLEAAKAACQDHFATLINQCMESE